MASIKDYTSMSIDELKNEIQRQEDLIENIKQVFGSTDHKIDQNLIDELNRRSGKSREYKIIKLKSKIDKKKKELESASRLSKLKPKVEEKKIREATNCSFNVRVVGKFHTLHFGNSDTYNDSYFRRYVEDESNKYILDLFSTYKEIKSHLTGKILLRDPVNNEYKTWPRALPSIILRERDERSIRLQISNQIDRLIAAAEEANMDKSGLEIVGIESISINLTQNAIHGAGDYIETPDIIKNKRATLNIKNKDNKCLLWCILASLYPADSRHADRISKYITINHNLDLSDINFPTGLTDIRKFEDKNNICINVYGYNDDSNSLSIYPLYNSKFKYDPTIKNDDQPRPVVELLLLEEKTNIGGNLEVKNHYILIKDFKRLNPRNCRSNENSRLPFVICRRCMNHFYTQNAYHKHSHFCENIQPQCIMPKEGSNNLEFRNYINSLKHHVAVYADIETMLVDDGEHRKKHIPFSISFVVTGIISKFKLYRGENCLSSFVSDIRNLVHEFSEIQNRYKNNYTLTDEEKERHNNTEICWICKQEFSENDKKVVDHCHTTGEYIGAAHQTCNLNHRRIRKFIPIIFHNLSRYDSHIIMNVLSQFGNGKTKIIPRNDEEYISFTKKYNGYDLKFLDSYRFLPTSLDTLSTNLIREDKNLAVNLIKYMTDQEKDVIFWNEVTNNKSINVHLDNDFKSSSKYDESIDKKPRIKGIFPYEFIDSWDKLNYDKILRQYQFYDSLNQKNISDQEYIQYKNVWNSIPDCNIGKYSDLYLKTDVLILADVFENFRTIGLQHYGLDPVYYYTTPGYTFDACLKHTNVKLELFTDIDMMLMIEKGIRGGFSGVTGNRYVDVEGKNYITNPNIDKDDPNQEWLLYIDANNLYGYAMSQKLPTGGFKWMTEKSIKLLDKKIRDGTITDEGYILDVDLIVPKTEQFKNLPLAPENKTIKYDQLSDYQKSLVTEKEFVKSGKLILDFIDKKSYVINVKNLVLYHKLGCEFKINYGISFNQSCWLKDYIDFNTELRKNAKNEFEKDFFKLMNNAMFGKSIENIRNRVNIQLVNNWEQGKFYIRKPTYDKFKILTDELIAIHMKKDKITFNKPTYIGFCVLELSKHLMYDVYYNRLQKMFNDIKLLYTDTDSFVLHIKDSNIYKIMQQNNDLFDFSDYPKDHVLYSTDNKKVLGKFKDELNGNIMTKRISLRSKMYCHKTFNSDKENKRAKGIKKCNVNNELNFTRYYDCLFKNRTTEHTFQLITSENHKLYTINMHKKGLDPLDTKMYYRDENCPTPFI